MLDTTDSTVREFHFDPSRVVVTGEELRDGALDLTTGLLICFQYYRDSETRSDLRVLCDGHENKNKMMAPVSLSDTPLDTYPVTGCTVSRKVNGPWAQVRKGQMTYSARK